MKNHCQLLIVVFLCSFFKVFITKKDVMDKIQADIALQAIYNQYIRGLKICYLLVNNSSNAHGLKST